MSIVDIIYLSVWLIFTREEAGFSEIRGALVLVIQRDQNDVKEIFIYCRELLPIPMASTTLDWTFVQIKLSK
jgi:hypothetical protein